MHYNLAAAGGTFDHLHDGHERFLTSILERSNRLLLGLTTDNYVKQQKHWLDSLESYETRKNNLLVFFQTHNLASRVAIEPINTNNIPKIWENMTIDALFVTSDSRAGAEALNKNRVPLPPINIVSINLIANDDGKKIASSDIRAGKINSHGHAYISETFGKKDLLLPDRQRQLFKQPFGELHTDNSTLKNVTAKRLVTVGDVTTFACLQANIFPKIAIIDLMVQRQESTITLDDMGFKADTVILPAHNTAGELDSSLIVSLRKAIDNLLAPQNITILISGEEDLAVIPLVLLLPLAWVLIYGQPNEGFVKLEITPASKQKAKELLTNFKERP
jgi:cytidyltransferase-like protein